MRSATGGSTPPKFAPAGWAAPTSVVTAPTSLPSVVSSPPRAHQAAARRAHLKTRMLAGLFSEFVTSLEGAVSERHPFSRCSSDRTPSQNHLNQILVGH